MGIVALEAIPGGKLGQFIHCREERLGSVAGGHLGSGQNVFQALQDQLTQGGAAFGSEDFGPVHEIVGQLNSGFHHP
ncbi:MAG: hypothetical protein O3A87_03420 [Verrucomicrobia bacterium]|nr:hypothetical protein [Verrucomicrobiota bacterium]